MCCGSSSFSAAAQPGMLPRDIAINQMLHPQEARYDTRRFNWIGRISSYTGVVFVTTRTGVKTVDDLKPIAGPSNPGIYELGFEHRLECCGAAAPAMRVQGAPIDF
jgi:hypothetical protein